MSTALITGVFRQQVKDLIFLSTHFALRFHQNLRYVYTFSLSGWKGSRVLVSISTNSMDHLINWQSVIEKQPAPCNDTQLEYMNVSYSFACSLLNYKTDFN